MQVIVFGVLSMVGRAKKTGSAYSIRRALVGSPVQPKVTQDFTREGYGYEATEVEVDEVALPEFAGHKYPCLLDLRTDMRPIGGKLVPVVVGVQAVKG